MVKLRPNFGLAAAASKVNLRPLYESRRDRNVFGVSDAPAWYIADLPDTTGPNAWDLAHARVADQLGIDASAVLFAEPDLDRSFARSPFARMAFRRCFFAIEVGAQLSTVFRSTDAHCAPRYRLRPKSSGAARDRANRS